MDARSCSAARGAVSSAEVAPAGTLTEVRWKSEAVDQRPTAAPYTGGNARRLGGDHVCADGRAVRHVHAEHQLRGAARLTSRFARALRMDPGVRQMPPAIVARVRRREQWSMIVTLVLLLATTLTTMLTQTPVTAMAYPVIASVAVGRSAVLIYLDGTEATRAAGLRTPSPIGSPRHACSTACRSCRGHSSWS